ncbi:MAG TPA: hypothetical protein VHK27_05555 [Gammaproteobacteria bacterium]|nr:hypothetical protein [Gammaproteobacteria bacterium]
MNEFTCLLLTILSGGNGLMQVAVKIKKESLPDDFFDFPDDDDHKDIIHSRLPPHIQNCGPIVDIKFLFDCVEIR